MKIRLSAVLLTSLVLGACAPQSDAGKQAAAAPAPAVAPAATGAVAAPGAAAVAPAAAAPAADQAQTAQNGTDQQPAPVKKKKCGDNGSTGSRLGGCSGGSGDMVSGTSGDNYRDVQRQQSTALPGHN